MFFGERLLPHSKGKSIPADPSRHARTLVEHYRLDQGVAREPTAESPETLFTRVSGLAEVVIPPRSGLIGRPVFPGMVTESGDLVIRAVQHRGEDMGPGEHALAAGDSLLLQGTWKALDEHLDDPDVLAVDSPEVVRRQAVPMGAGATPRSRCCWRWSWR